jgi:hypothetical protein
MGGDDENGLKYVFNMFIRLSLLLTTFFFTSIGFTYKEIRGNGQR